MKHSFKNAAVFALFDKAENVSINIATELMELGIGSREDATPYVMAWASERNGNAPIREGQRGIGFDRSTKNGNAAYMQMYRILNFLYSVPKAGAVHSEGKKKFDAKKAAKQLAEKYTKAQLKAILALL
jgi:hypothetical protein